MACLLVDIGNTCVKYALLDNVDEPVVDVECLWGMSFAESLAALKAALPSSLTQAAISCVGKRDQLHDLEAMLAAANVSDVRRASVANNWQGFVLGYQDPAALGVDRWLAMLAVREKLAANQVGILADCGTAVTVEGISREQHLGGLIAPGLGLMARALNRDTADLPAVDHQHLDGDDWAHSTEEAIAGGCIASTLGLLERQKQLLENSHSLPVVAYLTGGDSINLRGHLVGWTVDSSLVLEGLRLWVREFV